MIQALAAFLISATPFIWIEEKMSMPYSLAMHDTKSATLAKLNHVFHDCIEVSRRYNGLKGELWFVYCQLDGRGYAGVSAGGYSADSGSDDLFGLSELEVFGQVVEKSYKQSLVSKAKSISCSSQEFLSSEVFAITTPPWFKFNGNTLNREIVIEINNKQKSILWQEWMAWDKDIRVKFAHPEKEATPTACFAIMCVEFERQPIMNGGYGGRGGGIGCGSRGGPGWRKPNGQCASWRD